MISDTPTLPWTEEQWSLVHKTVQEGARKARVAASFLPLYGPLPPDQVTVRALPMSQSDIDPQHSWGQAQRLEVDDGDMMRLTTIAVEVYVKTHEAQDPELAAALSMLGRAADVLGRLEDAIVFNGQKDKDVAPHWGGNDGPVVVPHIYTVSSGQPNPGLLGGYGGLRDKSDPCVAIKGGKDLARVSESLVNGIVAAISELEAAGHYGPFASVLGDHLFLAANSPSPHSMVLPSDRIIPFLDGPLLRSSTIPDGQGVVVALAGAPIDLVIARDLHVTYVQTTPEPRHVLRVSERFGLRIKQPGAVVVLCAEGRGN